MPENSSIPGVPYVTLLHPSGVITVTSATVAGVVQNLIPSFADSGIGRRSLWTLINLSATGTLWCSKSDPAPAPNKPGCYPLGPGAIEQFTAPGFVPVNGLWAISDGSSIPVTVELG